MSSGAIDAKENSIGNRRPRRILSIAIETHLVLRLGFELPENGDLVDLGGGHGGERFRRERGGGLGGRRRSDPMPRKTIDYINGKKYPIT